MNALSMIKKIGKINPRLRWILIVLLAILVLLLLLRRAGAERCLEAYAASPGIILSTGVGDRPESVETTQSKA